MYVYRTNLNLIELHYGERWWHLSLLMLALGDQFHKKKMKLPKNRFATRKKRECFPSRKMKIRGQHIFQKDEKHCPLSLCGKQDRWINLGGFCFLEHFVLFIIHENRVAIVFSPHFILRPVKRRKNCAFLSSFIGETLSRNHTRINCDNIQSDCNIFYRVHSYNKCQ